MKRNARKSREHGKKAEDKGAKKLVLNKETVRSLSETELSDVAGGNNITFGCPQTWNING